MTVSSRCTAVHCSASASGITSAAFALSGAAMNSFQVFGAAVMPAFRQDTRVVPEDVRPMDVHGHRVDVALVRDRLTSCFDITFLKPYF